MEKVSKETECFDKYMKIVNGILKISRLSLDENDRRRTIAQRLRNNWLLSFNIFFFNLTILMEIAWLIESFIVSKSIIEITYFMPCLTLCLLGELKAYYFVKYTHHVIDVEDSLRKLQNESKATQRYREEVEENLLKKRIPMLKFAIYSLLYTNSFGIVTFALGPLIFTALKYYSTGEIHLFMPFLVWYPFKPEQFRAWPFTYSQQLWAATMAVFTVIGPDNFFSTCCTFIATQFHCLHYDLEKMNMKDNEGNNREMNESFKTQLVNIVKRHKELIRCVELLERIYSKSTLFNVATSSLIICATGFNVTTIDNYVLVTPFISFLTMGLFQIFLFCYYGDLLMESSMEVSNAVFKSQWYNANAKVMKDLLIISIRSQKACKLTAWKFVDINLSTFCRIMGSAWSYFTLLKTVYRG